MSRQLQAPEIVYNVCVMPKPPVKPPKIVSSSKSSTVRRDIVNGEKTYIAKGTIYRERIHSAGGPGAGAFANGGGPPPNGGGLMNSVQGGLMISNSCVISLGKWCAYIQIDTVENYITPAADIPQAVDGFGFSSSADDSEKAKSKVALSQYWHSTPRRFFVGKFDSELEAKVNMDMVSSLLSVQFNHFNNRFGTGIRHCHHNGNLFRKIAITNLAEKEIERCTSSMVASCRYFLRRCGLRD